MCPVYRLTRHERFAPRGKYALIQHLDSFDKKDTDLFPIAETLKACLQCGACASACKAGVAVDGAIREARAAGQAGTDPPWWLKGLFDSPRGLEQAASLAARYPNAAGLGLRLLGAKAGLDLKEMVHLAAAESFLSKKDRTATFTGPGTPRILFFVGCVQNVCFPEAAEAVLEILRQGAGEVVIPSDQGCCGMALYSAGSDKEAKRRAVHNLEIIERERPDLIVTGCATCASMIKKWERLFEHGDPFKRSSLEAGRRVYELSNFMETLLLDKIHKIERAYWTSRRKVTFHLPCHQKYGLRQEQDCVRILARCFGTDFVKMEQGCCGQGGLFGVAHPEESAKMAVGRIDSALETGASIVVTTCSGCLLQWKAAVHRQGIDIESRHLAEVVKWQKG